MINPQDDHEYNLLFGVQLSIRYHDRRCGWFEAWHNSTMALALFMVLADALLPALALGPHAGPLFSLAGAAVLALNIVFGFSARAAKHSRLSGRFLALESKLLPLRDLSEQELQRYNAERNAIEHDEPPVKSLLNALCYFQNWIATNRDADLSTLDEIPLWRRLLAHIANQSGYTGKIMHKVGAKLQAAGQVPRRVESGAQA